MSWNLTAIKQPLYPHLTSLFSVFILVSAFLQTFSTKTFSAICFNNTNKLNMQLLKALVLSFLAFQASNAIPMPAPEPVPLLDDCQAIIEAAVALMEISSEIMVQMVCIILVPNIFSILCTSRG